MAKKKRSWKKKLGKALMAGAALAGGLALAKNRNRAASIGDVEASEAGFGNMRLKDYGPHSIGGYHTPRVKKPVWTGDQRMVDPYPIMYKKGGRVRGAGKAKRGLGRAFSKGGK